MDDRALETMDAMAAKLLLDSRPPFRMAAFPDLMARAEMLAMTSGRASKIIKSTPMGHVMRERVRLSSSNVFAVVWLTALYQSLPKPSNWRYKMSDRVFEGSIEYTYLGLPTRPHRECPGAYPHTSPASPDPTSSLDWRLVFHQLQPYSRPQDP